MNYADDQNPHTEIFPYAKTVFWKRRDDNTESACGRDDKPTRATLTPAHGQWPSIDFELPRQRYELDKVRQLMHKAYLCGRADNRAELGRLLNDLIAP